MPLLKFGSDTWTLSKRETCRIKVMEMKLLRKILGITRRDRIRNDIIRDQLNIDLPDAFSDRRKIGWFGYMVRMWQNKNLRKICAAKIEHRKERGKIQCNNSIKDILKYKNMSMSDAKKMAKGKPLWKRFVRRQEI